MLGVKFKKKKKKQREIVREEARRYGNVNASLGADVLHYQL